VDFAVKTRVTLAIGEENWVLKLEITGTARYHLWEVYDISRYESSSHLGSLVLFKIMEEREGEVKVEFLNFFSYPFESRGEIHLRGVGLSHPKILKFGMWLKFTKS
jgi:hypothetical protein